MKILIVDDEMLARKRLARLLDEQQPQAEIIEAENGERALAQVAEHQPDLLLLDIQMPGLDGLQVARQLSSEPNPPAVIFCTAFDEYAMAAFESQAIGYLLKPIKRDQLREALQRGGKLNRLQLAAISTVNPEKVSDEQQLKVRSHHGVELLPLQEVRCLLADHKYVTAIYPEGEALLDDTLKELEQRFPTQLIRIHRKALVARRYLCGLERYGDAGWRVQLRGVTIKPLVSRRHLPELRRLFDALS